MSIFGYKDICWFDVSMDDTLGVRCVQSLSHANRYIEQLFQFHRATGNNVLQSFAFQILHSDEGPTIFLANVINRANVRMIESRSSLGFPPKSLHCLSVVG